ncbi:hypothetical protein [Sphingomonas baiyangensis]|uniref:Uncharacterized protein n=1 Tax=Sphingomonas baiyangensis TaxID=2572576 RepID=A0A4U1L2Z1_9SPHN|nr:hypothetical protein [Sphingomonas baiyangensis]TKD50590.1 hypothetical protein FBR43_07285 [Sphingomonas baiyangensis]
MLGAGASGGLLTAWWAHQRHKRRQSDSVALDMVAKQDARIAALEARIASDRKAAEAREELCEAQLSLVRHELKNVEGAFDALLLALRHAPPERFAAIIDEVTEMRRARRVEQAERRGEVRQEVQVEVSGRNLRDRARADLET